MFQVYGESLFLQPNGSSLYYAAVAFPFNAEVSVPIDCPNWFIKEIFPSYSAAFKVGTKVLFSDLDTNIEMNWERLCCEDSSSYSVPLEKDMVGPLFDIGPNSAAYLDSWGKIKFRFDSVDLLFGQQGCFFKRLYPNFFAGGSFTRINQVTFTNYSNTAAYRSRLIQTYSKFTGAGPKFGLDFEYRMIKGFFFTGTSSLALIIGESQNGTTYESAAPYLAETGMPIPNVQTTTVPNRTQVVPGLEEKLGFSYIGDFYCFRVEFGAGYQAQVFLNAIQSIDMTAPQVEPSLLPLTVPDSAVFAVGFERTLSNFILSGPYIYLSLTF